MKGKQTLRCDRRRRRRCENGGSNSRGKRKGAKKLIIGFIFPPNFQNVKRSYSYTTTLRLMQTKQNKTKQRRGERKEREERDFSFLRGELVERDWGWSDAWRIYIYDV